MASVKKPRKSPARMLQVVSALVVARRATASSSMTA
jgi:hypothetical protein